MPNTVIQQLNQLGQSIWLDNISRSMFTSGRLKELIALGLRGITSNPTIFNKAISGGVDYDSKIAELSTLGKPSFEIYDELTVADIRQAAKMFLPVYEATKGLDGYISLEINPQLAYNSAQTIEEGLRLYRKVNCANVMFKVPATPEGCKAIEHLTAQGINVNATLIFSLEQYKNTAQAYLSGVKQLLQNNGQVQKVRSVASVFVSRIDTVCDKLLNQASTETKDQRKQAEIAALKGKAAVANVNLIYKSCLEILSSSEFKDLQSQGVNLQRVLWGSTSTKNPAYPDIKYVAELIAKDTVNTMPEATFAAFLDHGQAQEALTADVQDAEQVVSQLRALGIDLNAVCAQLLQDGVDAFVDSFKSLLDCLAEKIQILCRR